MWLRYKNKLFVVYKCWNGTVQKKNYKKVLLNEAIRLKSKIHKLWVKDEQGEYVTKIIDCVSEDNDEWLVTVFSGAW